MKPGYEKMPCLSMNIQALLGGARPKVVKLQSAIRALE